MIGRLPPVGQRVPLGPRGPEPAFPGFHCLWLNSGTAALALAIAAAIKQRAPAREVILPAYGCPDLVAAAVHAGARPVLVDCAADDPAYELDRLEHACSPDTAAIVAVNFLGIGERLTEIRGICTQNGALLIEDCAQSFPESRGPVAVDARIVSFGRGKPVNLLGGGALLLPEGGLLSVDLPDAGHRLLPLTPLKSRLFNLLLGRVTYGVVSRLPGLHLGETRYHPLDSVQRMDVARLALAAAAIDAWTGAGRWREKRLESIAANSNALSPLPALGTSRAGRLLRYPMLASDPAARDALVCELRDFGASPFYAKVLFDIPGVAALLHRIVPCPGATRFAATHLTLPVHAGVDERQLQLLERRLKAFA